MTDISLTVNGTDVSLDVEPRATLADTLRHNLNLTGTHVGCEHGVCGACTVLVDGDAVRSCLMFAVQAQGSEVVTVEALGSADALHPLQEAFRERHGLQCGFCTPGFLMSAYELLRDGVDPDDERIAEELSGVLCRCTGYRGIVDAVRDVAAGGAPLPEPANMGMAITVVTPGGAPPTVDIGDAAPPTAAPPARVDLEIPEGEPNAVVEVATAVGHPVDAVWELLSDFPRASRCLPGVDLGEELGDDTYSGRAELGVGPLRFSFEGGARVIERDDDGHSLRAIASGRDASGGGVRADLRFTAEPGGDGGDTVVRAQARLHLSGRAAQFGRSMVGDVSRQLFQEFGRCVDRTLTTGEVAAPVRMRGGMLAVRALQGRLRSLWEAVVKRRRKG